MLDPAIDTFFQERKKEWLKKKISSTMGESEAEAKKQECDLIFSPEKWLPDAAKRAGQMSLSSHPCTFSHPSARKNKNGYVTSILANSDKESDGFLRSGNVDVESDALGNAAAMDVYKFLTLEMQDSRRLIEHILEDSKVAFDLLTVETESYENLKKGFMAIVASDNNSESITSSKVKQVFFPVKGIYHQLSLLSNSGIIFELKKRVDYIRFSEEVKEVRKQKRNNLFCEKQFSELYNLTTIGYGGTKPQNISVLNNRNGGKAYLFASMPPSIEKRNIRFPKRNFFTDSFRHYEYRDIFDALHKLFLTDYNNIRIREGRDFRLQDLIDRIIAKMWAVRGISKEQYFADRSQLKMHQKIWLCDEHRQIRLDENGWLDTLCMEIARWIINTYQKLLDKQAFMLGEPERLYILKIVENNREALR